MVHVIIVHEISFPVQLRIPFINLDQEYAHFTQLRGRKETREHD
jgi:hypothetical protein